MIKYALITLLVFSPITVADIKTGDRKPSVQESETREAAIATRRPKMNKGGIGF